MTATTTDRSKAVVLILFVLCVALRLLAFSSPCFVLFVVLLLCKVGPSYLALWSSCLGKGSRLLCFSWPVTCVLTFCHGLFALSLGVIGSLWYVTVVLPGHISYTILCQCKQIEALFRLYKCAGRSVFSLSTYQGPVVQSIVSLTSLLVVKMLTVLVNTISNLQVFLLKKCE